jgi:glycosyltransferase involved in cell wall biosynthesis
MNIKFITSKNLDDDSVGGIKNTSKLLIQSLSDAKLSYPRETNLKSLLLFIYKNNSNISKFYLIGYADIAVLMSILLIILNGRKVIYIPCFHPWWSTSKKIRAYIYEKTLFKLILIFSKEIICLSRWESNYLTSLIHCNCTIIMHPPKFRPLLNNVELSVPCDRKDIIFVGRNDYNKNLNEFFRLAEILEDKFNFVVVTDNINSIDFKNKSKKIKFLFNVSDEQIKSIYSKALAIYIPSRWESLSLVGVESISFGCKAFGSNSVKLLDNFMQYPSLMYIYSPGEDISSLIKFLNKKTDDEELRLFLANFSVDNMKKILKIL